MYVYSMLTLFPYYCLAQKASWWSIGPKIGYEFGSGLVGGFEATYLPRQSESLGPFYGITADVDFGHRFQRLHIGVEGMLFFGLDVGPTVTFLDNHVYSGFSIIPFLGIFIYPFYQFNVPFGDTIRSNMIGAYIKIPTRNLSPGPFN